MLKLMLLLAMLVAPPAHAYYFTIENTGEYSGISHLTVTLQHAPFYANDDYITLTATELGFTPIMPGQTFTSGELDTRGWYPVVLYAVSTDAGGSTYKNGITFSESWPDRGYGYTFSLLPGSPISSVPEPSTFLLLLSGMVLFKSAQYCSGVINSSMLTPTGGPARQFE